MKKPILLFLVLLLLAASACSARPTGTEPSATTAAQDLEAFVRQLDLPANLTIAFDPDQVPAVPSAAAYSADKILIDVAAAKKELLRREVAETKAYAEGPWFRTGDSSLAEYLCVYQGIHQGGLTYTLVRDGSWLTTRLANVICAEPGPDDRSNIGPFRDACRKSAFTSETDLPFMDYADARTALLDKLRSLGFPKAQIGETYTLDLDTIRAQHEIYRAEARAAGLPEDAWSDRTWSEADTCYLFLCRQQIDDLPVFGLSWQGQAASTSAAGDPMPASDMAAYWTQDGLASLRAYGWYALGQREPDQPLVGPVQALQAVLDDLGGVILSRPTWLASLELCYVSLPDRQDGDGFRLVPAWVAGIGEARERPADVGQAADPYIAYTYAVVDAVSGRKLSR